MTIVVTPAGGTVVVSADADVLVVPRDALAGLEDTCGKVVVRAPGAGAAWDRLELILAWGDDPRRIALDLGRPASATWRGASPASGRSPSSPPATAPATPRASARLVASLGPVSRALLHRAGRGR